MPGRRLIPALLCAACVAHVPTAVANNPATNFATEMTQIANNVQLLLQWVTQLDQAWNQARRLEHMLEQAQNFDGGAYADNPMGLIEQVRDITQQGMAISYAAANLEEVVAQRYRSYEEFLDENYNRDTYVEDYTNWTGTTQESITRALMAAGIQMESLADEEIIMAQLQDRVANAETRQQALQVASEVNVQNGRALQKLRQLVATNMQIQSSWYKQQNATDAARQAARQRFMVPEDQAPPIVGNERGWLP